MGTAITIKNLTKRFGDVVAVNDVSLTVDLTICVPGISKVKMDEKVWLKLSPEMINLYVKESGNLIASKN